MVISLMFLDRQYLAYTNMQFLHCFTNFSQKEICIVDRDRQSFKDSGNYYIIKNANLW